MINKWNKDAASLVGARVFCWHVIPVTLSRTPSWNGWHNIYRAAHQLNLLEPGIVLLDNLVPHFLRRCEDNIDSPIGCKTSFGSTWRLQVKALKYPQRLVGDDQCQYEIGCNDGRQQTPLSSLMESVDHFPRPSS